MKHAFKRAMDFICSLTLIILLSPLLIILAVLIRALLGSPVIFTQERPGLKAKIFTLYKFRSMTDERDANGKLLPDKVRLTRFGAFLRRTSMDELPELFNILKGDMSFIGPRPLLVRYLERYNSVQSRRHEVKPGLTGWAQVNGRNAISWEEKFELDVWYVDNWTVTLDIKILVLTLVKVMLKKGVNADGEATMYEFTGKGKDSTTNNF